MTHSPEARPELGEVSEMVAFLSTVASMFGDGIFAFDGNLRCVFWSAQMTHIFGLLEAEVLGLPPSRTLPFLGAHAERCAAEAIEGRSAVLRDRPFSVPGTGKHGFFDAYYFPIRSRNGATVVGAAVVRNVTEARRQEALRQETELRFKNMADVAPVLLWMSDTEGLCTFFNQTWLDFTGRTLEQEWGVGWAEGVHFEDFQNCMDSYVEAFVARRKFEIEYRLRRADGEYRWILDRGTPRYTPEGEFAGFIGSCVDITDRKQLEAELRRAVRDRDEFLSIAAHELRTPLTSLQLQVDSLAQLVERPEDQVLPRDRLKRSAQSATRQMRNMVTLVEQLLDVSRITIGSLDLSPEPTNLCTVVTDVTDRFVELTRANGGELVVSVPPAVNGSFDRARLTQVVSNLLANAVKFAAGTPIHVSLEGKNGHAHLTVKDRGPGIAPEDQSRIFERFERTLSSRNFGGFGLGLWISRQIVEAHGGKISLESQSGKGAAFTVELPLSR